MKLEDFIGALEGVGLDIGVEEILDTLWLASQGRALSLHRQTDHEDITPEPASLPPTPAAAGRTIPESEKPDPQVRPGSTAAGASASGTADVYALGSLSSGDRTIKAIPVAVPAGRALHNRLGLMRALKPLRQRWPSHRSSELDEERTAEATAELRAFHPSRVYPVLRPSPVPWFDVDLIQEDDPAIELWSEVLRDFAQMLRETGAFRVVRTWRLRLPPREAKVAISPGSTYTRPAAALEAPTGARVWSRSLEGGARRLIIFASHGSSIHWPDGSYARLLKTWSRRSGSVLLHLMARERWPHTLLGEPHGLCATDSPGPTSATLRVEPFWWRVPVDEITSLLPLPAVALDADDVDEWAKMYMARGRHCSIFLLDPKLDPKHEGDSASELVEIRELDEWRIANLRQVSPEAFQLAVYLSTSPFTIPVARLIQAAKFGPGAGLGQLAEVFLSGLLVALAPKGRRHDPSTIYYDFRPKARAILLRSLRDADAKKIAAELQKRLSTHIEVVSGQPFTFRGLVPKAAGTSDLPIWAQPFARVGLSLLGLHQTAGTAPAEAATVQGSETERSAVLAEALAALALHLPEAERSAVLAEALGAARGIRGEGERAEALAALALHGEIRVGEVVLRPGVKVQTEFVGPGKGEVKPITVLHLSDMQFGKNHRFGVAVTPEGDNPYDTLRERLILDLRKLRKDHGLVPDLMVLTGDLAEWGREPEFDGVLDLIVGLEKELSLARDRLIVIPGNHDINRDACEAYFKECSADDLTPVKPYWPKWRHYAHFFGQLYRDIPKYVFSEEQYWTLFDVEPLKVVVAGLNSTIAESHRYEDHYGWVGELQLRWFAEKLATYKREGWLRIGAVHHNVMRGAELDEENLRDASDLKSILGTHLNCILHGHTHHAQVEWWGPSLPILSIGSAAVGQKQRPEEVPNQYQIIQFWSERIVRYSRAYDPRGKEWIPDARIGEGAVGGRQTKQIQFQSVQAAFPPWR